MQINVINSKAYDLLNDLTEDIIQDLTRKFKFYSYDEYKMIVNYLSDNIKNRNQEQYYDEI